MPEAHYPISFFWSSHSASRGYYICRRLIVPTALWTKFNMESRLSTCPTPYESIDDPRKQLRLKLKLARAHKLSLAASGCKQAPAARSKKKGIKRKGPPRCNRLCTHPRPWQGLPTTIDLAVYCLTSGARGGAESRTIILHGG